MEAEGWQQEDRRFERHAQCQTSLLGDAALGLESEVVVVAVAAAALVAVVVVVVVAVETSNKYLIIKWSAP